MKNKNFQQQLSNLTNEELTTYFGHLIEEQDKLERKIITVSYEVEMRRKYPEMYANLNRSNTTIEIEQKVNKR